MTLEMKMLIMFLVMIFATVRACIVSHNHDKVANAIFDYHIMFYDLTDVDYESMEPEWKTYLHFWDWGCKHIVPKHVYEKIKLFL